jgi:hypothetical protein
MKETKQLLFHDGFVKIVMLGGLVVFISGV